MVSTNDHFTNHHMPGVRISLILKHGSLRCQGPHSGKLFNVSVIALREDQLFNCQPHVYLANCPHPIHFTMHFGDAVNSQSERIKGLLQLLCTFATSAINPCQSWIRANGSERGNWISYCQECPSTWQQTSSCKPAVVSAPAIRNGRIKLEVTVLGSSYPHQKKKSDSDVKLLEAFCFFSGLGKNRVETEHKYIHQDN